MSEYRDPSETRPLIGPEDGQRDDDMPSMLIEDARQRLREEEDRNNEGRRLLRRLFVAFLLIALLGIVFYIVLPRYGVRMPPILPVLCFGAIIVGTGLTAMENTDKDTH